MRKRVKKRREKTNVIPLIIIILIIILILLFLFTFFNKPGKPGGGLPSLGIGKEIGVKEWSCQTNAINPYTIIPYPQNITILSCNQVNVDSSWKIYADLNDNYDNFTAYYLQNKTFDKTGILLQVDDIENIGSNKRIIIGNPNINSVASSAANTAGINFNSEITKGFNQGYVLIVNSNEVLILGNSTAGSFYGTVSLTWLLNNSGNNIVLPNIKIDDWPDLEVRGYLWGGANYTPNDFIEILAKYKYNLRIGTVPGGLDNPLNIQLALDFKKFITDRHFFSFGGAQPDVPPYYNYNLYEGYYAHDISMVFNDSDNAVSAESFDVNMANLDFEEGLKDDNSAPKHYTLVKPKWSYISDKTNWTLDCTQSHSGDCSMHLNLSVDLTNLLHTSEILYSKNYSVKKGRFYQVSFWAKKNDTNNYSGVYAKYAYPLVNFNLFNDNNVSVVNIKRSISNSDEWKQYIISFSTFNNNISYVSFNSRAEGTKAIDYWIDDIIIVDVTDKLKNVIKTNATRIHVWNKDRNLEYSEGIDYFIKEIGSFNQANPISGKTSLIIRNSSGRIAKNAEIKVDYDFLAQPSNLVRYPSLSEPLLFEVWEKSVKNSIQIYNPNYYFLNPDEIRGINRDSRSIQKELKNYQLFAEYINNLTKIIYSYNPDIKIIIWDDMQNPFHNGGYENYQYGSGEDGPSGKTWYALDLMDRKLGQISWKYEPETIYAPGVSYKIRMAPLLYNKYGFEWYAGPGDWISSEKESTDTKKQWSYVSYKYNASGYIQHDFSPSVDNGLVQAANYSWNAVKSQDICDPYNLEFCDRIDNNCNGKVDEGFNLTLDAFNCGGCGNICYLPYSYQSCINGTCHFDGCYENYIYVNGNCVLDSCGNNICDDGETCSSCPGDCGICTTPPTTNPPDSNPPDNPQNNTNPINATLTNNRTLNQSSNNTYTVEIPQNVKDYLVYFLMILSLVFLIVIVILLIVRYFKKESEKNKNNNYKDNLEYLRR